MADGLLRVRPQFCFTGRCAPSYRAVRARLVLMPDGEAAPDPTGIDRQRALGLAEPRL